MSDATSGAAAAYRREGYCVVTDCIDHDAIDAFLGDIRGVLNAQVEHCRLPVANKASGLESIYEMLGALHRYDQDVYVATLRVFNKFKSLYDLFLDSSIASVCRDCGVVLPMMHTLPLFHIMSNRLAIARGYHGFGAHQDWTALQTSLNTVVVWLPFHDIDRRRFPLEVLPRSHWQGVRPGTADGADYRIDDSYYRDQEFVTLEVRKGDVVFMSPFTIHRTGLTDTDQLRIAASWRYEDALEPTFVDRRYPFAQTRSIKHELFFPGFPDRARMEKLLIRSAPPGRERPYRAASAPGRRRT